MDKKFLNKVVDQIVRETEIDYDRRVIETPFSPHVGSILFFPPYPFVRSFPLPLPFLKHCKDVYGLNIQETEYVWGEYREIIIDEIENNG